jgi:Tfp pilus assembly protein PilO
MKRKGAAVLAGLVALLAGAVFVYVNYQKTAPLPAQIEDRRPKLKQLVAEQEIESAKAVAGYLPANKTWIDDLDSPVVELLRQLPGVVRVEVAIAATKPTRRIVHLRDYHFVPKDLYALDMKQAHGRELTDDEIDRLHQELLLEVELVQVEQMAILRCLIKHHGLKRIVSEGFSPGELENYRERIAVLRSMEKEQVPQVRKQLEEVRKLLEGATGEKKEKAVVIEAQLVTMLDEHKHRMLEMGAAGRLLISGELEDVLPLEDAVALEKAKPISPSGGVKLDPVKLEARHDAQVKATMKEGPVAVIVLGGSHDLSASVRRLGGGNCEYLRVTTKRFRELAE